MKQIIEIEVPDGKKAVWKNGTIVFEDIKPKLPKTWKEFCEQNKIKKEEVFYDGICTLRRANISGDTRHSYVDRNILPSEQAAEQHLALMQLHQLRDCYRQGWVPNWDDENEERYYIYSSRYYFIIDIAVISMFLTFQSKEIAEEFLNNFRDLIEQAGDLI